MLCSFSISFTLPYHAFFSFFFFNDTATTEIYTLSLHDALPIFAHPPLASARGVLADGHPVRARLVPLLDDQPVRSEEHTSELQSLAYLVCRLLLEKKKKHIRCSYVLTFSQPYIDKLDSTTCPRT